MFITVKMLKDKKACHDQIELFQETFGDAVEVTKENCIRAALAGLSILWAARNLINEQQTAAYKEARAPLLAAYEEAKAPLWAAYREAKAPLWAAYEEAEALLWAAYEEAEAPLLAAYEEAEAPLLAAYEEAKAPLLAAYREAKAIAFCNAIIGD